MNSQTCDLSKKVSLSDTECFYLYHIVLLSVINIIKNLFYNQNNKISEIELTQNYLLKLYEQKNIKIKQPTLTSKKLNLYKNVFREKKYFMLILARYLYSNEAMSGRTYYDSFIKNYDLFENEKFCNNIIIEYDDDDFMLNIPYDKKYEYEISTIIQKFNIDISYKKKVIGTNDILLLSVKRNSPTYKKSIIYIFQILHKILLDCKRDISFINVGEYPNDRKRAHRVILVSNVDHVKKNLDLFFYNPHGSQYSSVFEEVKKILDKNRIQIKNNTEKIIHRVSIYIKEASCNIGFQVTSGDKVGFCMIYVSFWFNLVLESLYNIKKFNEINKNINLDINFLKWIGYISTILDNLKDILLIFDETKKEYREIIQEEKFEIILRYSENLYNNIIQKMKPDEQKEFFSKINKDLEYEYLDKNPFHQFIQSVGQGDLTGTENIKMYGESGYGSRMNEETNIIPVSLKRLERYLPERVDDMQLLQEEKAYEHNILKYITKGSYEHRCQTHEDCKYKSLYCDKLEPNEEYGSCEVKKKINMIGNKCDKNEDCVSNICKENLCRIDYNDKIKNKLDFN